MNENINRLRDGWFPRKDAPGIFFIIADIIILKSIIKNWIIRKVQW